MSFRIHKQILTVLYYLISWFLIYVVCLYCSVVENAYFAFSKSWNLISVMDRTIKEFFKDLERHGNERFFLVSIVKGIYRLLLLNLFRGFFFYLQAVFFSSDSYKSVNIHAYQLPLLYLQTYDTASKMSLQ